MNGFFPVINESDIQGFDILRSDSKTGFYTKLNGSLLSPSLRTLNDPNPNRVNYYQVRVLDDNGFEALSFSALGQPSDTLAPTAPIGLIGNIEVSGNTTIIWKGNNEDDLKGYRVM